MLWRVGNPTIAEPWKMLWRHMLAAPPIFTMPHLILLFILFV
jgi:hypothetical protein